MNRVLVLGLGHPQRGDDGASRLVLERLRPHLPAGVEARELPGGALDLLAAWEGSARVLVLDALAAPRPPGTVLVLDLAAAPPPVPPPGASGHGLGLAEAVALARATGSLPPRLLLVGIVGACWQAGAPVSPAVAAAVDAAAEQALAVLQDLAA